MLASLFSETFNAWRSPITLQPPYYSAAVQSCFILAVTNLVFGQLYFAGLQVNADWLTALQLFSSSGEPCVKLIQCVLELTQTQQSTLQLMLMPEQEKKS